QGVIHRDVKPSNLMLSPQGRLSLNDFGLARMLEQPGVSMTGEFVGSPTFMSPEQAMAGRVPVDHRTDVYSLGATLYELLTLHPPYDRAETHAILADVIARDPRTFRQLNLRLPRDLETITFKALEKDPERRYRSARELGDDLRRFLNYEAIQARPPGAVVRALRWARRQRRNLVIGAAAV